MHIRYMSKIHTLHRDDTHCYGKATMDLYTTLESTDGMTAFEELLSLRVPLSEKMDEEDDTIGFVVCMASGTLSGP